MFPLCRSSLVPALQLYNVRLVVPQEEVVLVLALLEAASVLHTNALLWTTGGTEQAAVQDPDQAPALSQPTAPCSGMRRSDLSRMLQYAASWRAASISATSVRMEQWAYYGVAGEGVTITSELPANYSSTDIVAHVPAAHAAVAALVSGV